MSAGGTRAGSAAVSLRAKEEIIRVLFGRPNVAKKDGTNYSYSELRTAYLGRIQEIHPDKHKSKYVDSFNNCNSRSSSLSSSSSSTAGAAAATTTIRKNDIMERYNRQFTELQQAWDSYETLVKSLKKVGKGDNDVLDSNFTLFGVGCSFSDNEMERNFRNEIMDQACRGWFSSGAISETSTIKSSVDAKEKGQVCSEYASKISLVDDDMFVSVDEVSVSVSVPSTTGANSTITRKTEGGIRGGNDRQSNTSSSLVRPSLVGGFKPRQFR